MAEKITELSAEDARKYFLDAKCYSTIDLPKYFDFQPLLDALSFIMKDKTLEDISLKEDCGNKKEKQPTKYPSQYDSVNYSIYQNKDGNFAWRKSQLIHPAIYIYLVNLITEEYNWKIITRHFKKCSYDERLMCCSSLYGTTDKSDIVENWWKYVEQKSIELSLDFNWLAITDITDCYGSLYTHSISWAIHGKEKCKKNLLLDKDKQEKLFGDKLDAAIRQMTYNQTNGIPQCSILMDFIAEIVLAYADRILLWKLYKAKINEYKILRYRDDYRIFTKSKEDVVIILRLLSEVLADLNFKLNESKTIISQELIRDSLKPDKLYWNAVKQEETTLQKQLLLIHNLAKEYPNSGSVAKSLTVFMERIDPLKTKIQDENTLALVGILTDIAIHNPRGYALIATIIAKLTAYETSEVKKMTFIKVMRKLKPLPNAGLLLLWIQRMTIKSNLKLQEFDNELLCKVFYTRNNIGVWNNEWLREAYRKIIENTSIISEGKIDKMPVIPDNEEVKLFVDRY